MNVSFSIQKGEIIGIIGRNGVGKTTLLKCILGLIHFDSGDIIYDEKILLKCGNGLPLKVSGILDDIKLIEEFSGYDNIREHLNLYGNYDKKRVKELIIFFELESHIYKKVSSYSLGTRKKISIIMTLAVNANLYILDEPFNSLDPVIVSKLCKHIKYLSQKENKAFLLSSHLLSECEKICDGYVFMNKSGKYALKYPHVNEKKEIWCVVIAKEERKQFKNKLKKHKFFFEENEEKQNIKIYNILQDELLALLIGYHVKSINRQISSLANEFFSWEKG